jgi:catechol 2,3-dioxygenase-like lactoylglutathione lyase family enzyme
VKVERVDFVDIPTRDLERAIAFYRDVLQLPQNPRQPTEFEAGNVTLALWEPEDQGVEFPTSAAHGIALRVEDVAAARGELEAKGVEFVGERDSGVCNMAFFTDPDGNSRSCTAATRLRSRPPAVAPKGPSAHSPGSTASSSSTG